MRTNDADTDAQPRPCNGALSFVAAICLLLAGLVAVMGPSTPVDAYGPNLWVGSPVSGKWNADAATHHRFYKLTALGVGSDWATDISQRSDQSSSSFLSQQVRVFASTSNPTTDSQLSASVVYVIKGNACRYGGGGDLVVVEFYQSGVGPIGRAVYGHVRTTFPEGFQSSPIARWGGSVGTIANLSGTATGGSSCWTGPHVHFELRAQRDYACWNKGYTIGFRVEPSNFVGFAAGNQLTRYARPCP